MKNYIVGLGFVEDSYAADDADTMNSNVKHMVLVFLV